MDEENGQSSNRLFILVAVALIGLICIGLLGLSGILLITRANRAQQELAAVEAELPTPIPPTLTPTSTNTATPTNTPEPTPTSTPVVVTNAGPAAQDETQPDQAAGLQPPGDTQAQATATNTPVAGPTPVATAVVPTATPATVPASGGVLATDTSFLLWTAGGFLLILLIYSTFTHFKT